jgi:hypothetical protein
MANAWYPIYKQNLLAGTASYDLDVDTATDGPFCALVDTGVYTYNVAHDFADDLSTSRVGTDQRLTAPTVTNGTFDGSDLTYTAVSGATVEALVVYRHNSGAIGTWPLVLYLDTGVTGLPVTPNGGNITVQWSNTAPAGLATLSDARAKEDIRQIGRARNGLPIYEYRYRGLKPLFKGLIAQDVLGTCEVAVHSVNGMLAVDYERALA